MITTAPEIVLILTALGAVIVQIIQAWRTSTKVHETAAAMKENTSLTAQTLVKTDTIAITAAKIDGHVNSEKTAAEGRETTLRRENELLRQQSADLKEQAALLAQAVAQRNQQANGTSALKAAVPIRVEVVNPPTSPVPITEDKTGA